MTIDVIDLRDFYSQRLGIVARQLINRGIRARWPDATGQRVLGLGYPTPYLGLFREDAERCIAFMPAAPGGLEWTSGRAARAAAAGGVGRAGSAPRADRPAGPGLAGGRVLAPAPRRRGRPHPAGPRAADVGRSGRAAARGVAGAV